MDTESGTPPTNTLEQTKKKRAPNWLPCEEEQLAITWIHVSEQPEFAVNQTGAMFVKKMESYFNTHSKSMTVTPPKQRLGETFSSLFLFFHIK